MRVITGSARGKRLLTLEGNDVRPTPQRVKEGIFSAIQFRVEGRRFLDLFAGSGQMGIEALSRGASEAVFVDQSKKSVEIIKRNLQSAGLSEKAKIVNTDSMSFLKLNREPFDIAFLDPPYESAMMGSALEFIGENVKKTGIIICEVPENYAIPEEISGFTLDRKYRYGKIKIVIYCRRDVSE